MKSFFKASGTCALICLFSLAGINLSTKVQAVTEKGIIGSPCVMVNGMFKANSGRAHASGHGNNGYAQDIIANGGQPDFGTQDHACTNTSLIASMDGTVTYAGWDTTGYGNRIDITNGSSTLKMLYAHLSQINVSVNDVVTKGQIIGVTGGTGNASGNLVHIEVYKNGVKLPYANWEFGFESDLVAIKKNGANATEAHSYSGPSEFANKQYGVETNLAPSGSNFVFTYGDLNRDGVSDMIAVKKNGTSSGKTEAHVYDGKTQFSTKLFGNTVGPNGSELHETYDNFEFVAGDINADGYSDLVAVKKNGISSQKTEAHAYSGSDGFKTKLFGVTVGPNGSELGQTYDNFQFTMADVNHDFKADLIAVKKNGTSSGKTEAHVYSGSAQFKTKLFGVVVGATNNPLDQTYANYEFVAGDVNKDGFADLVAVKKYDTASDYTEAHVYSGYHNFGVKFIGAVVGNSGTPLHETDSNFDFIM